MRKILPILLLAISPLCGGSNLSWFAGDNSRQPDSESRKVENDFAGMLLVTPDRDWEDKWKTQSDLMPQFSETKTVNYGEELAVLTFFMNPLMDERNHAKVKCALIVKRPNRTIAVYEHGIDCLAGELRGDPKDIRLSPAVLKFVAEEGDPAGTWVIEIEINDVNRKTTLKLRTQFDLIESQG